MGLHCAKGRPEPAAVAVICFEWLQRPENVVAGPGLRHEHCKAVDGGCKADPQAQKTINRRGPLREVGDEVRAPGYRKPWTR